MANKWYSADNKPLDIPTFQDLQDVTGQVFDDAGLYIGPAELPKQQLVIDNVTKRQYYAPKEYTENAIRYAEAKRNEYFKPEDWFGMENIKADYTLGEQVIGGAAALGKSVTGLLGQLPTKIVYTGSVFANQLSKAIAQNNSTDIAKMKNGMLVEQENLYRMSMKNWENTLHKYGLINEPEIQYMTGGKIGSMIGDVGGSLLSAAAVSCVGGLPAVAAVFGSNQFADVMEEGLAKGLSHDKAFAAAWKAALAEGGLEAAGFRLWRNAATVSKSFRNKMLAFAWEGAQESSQQTAESIITNYYGIREQTFMEIMADVVLSGLIGGVVGFAGASLSGQAEQRNIALRRDIGMTDRGQVVTPKTQEVKEVQPVTTTKEAEKAIIDNEIAQAKKTGDNKLYNIVKYSANDHGITDEATIDKMYPVARKAIADGATLDDLTDILANQIVAYNNQLDNGQTDTKATQKAVEQIKLVTDPNRYEEWKESRKSELEKIGFTKEQAETLTEHLSTITQRLSERLGFDITQKKKISFSQNLSEIAGTRGQIELGKTVAKVALNKNADPTTVEHEFFHYIDRVVLDAAKEGNVEAQKLVKKRDEIIKKAKAELKKQGIKDMPIDEEILASAYEKWLWQGGKSEDAYEQKLFNAIREFFREVYDTVKGLMGIRITPEADAYFRAMTGEVPQTLYQFGGITARTADHAALTRAGEMMAEGKSNEEIRKETGWFRGVDGKWRFEISDKDMEISDKAYDYFANYMEASDRAQEAYANIKEYTDKKKSETNKAKLEELDKTIEKYEQDFQNANKDRMQYSEYLSLEELLKHDKLFQAYPSFRNIAVSVVYDSKDNRMASYSLARNAIYLNGDMFNQSKHKYNKAYPKEKRIQEIKSVLTHEIQHAIQEREGFSQGASITAFEEAPVRDRITKDIMEKRKKQARADFIKELEKRTGNKELVKDLMLEEKKYSEVLDKFFNNKISQAEASEEEKRFKELLKKAGISYSDYFQLYNEMEKKNGYDYKRVERINPFSPYELYSMVAGEIEARNTESRLEMSEEERLSASPESTQDIKNADAIVVFDDGTELSYTTTESPNIYYQPAYQGSPHRFNKFELSKIGTGEGAQAHGWGLYFAALKETAESYRYKLIEKEASPIGVIADDFYYKNKNYFMKDSGFYVSDTVDKNTQTAKKISLEDYRDAYMEAVEEDRQARERDSKKGQVYQVEIPENDVLLDEQKPLSEQTDFVKKALSKVYNEVFGRKLSQEYQSPGVKGFSLYKDGRQIYRQIADEVGSEENASLLLNKYGIKGITYYGKVDGRCYVIFDDKAIEMLNTFYQQEQTQEELFRNNQALKDGAKVLDKAPTNEQVENELENIRNQQVGDVVITKEGFGLGESIGDFVLTLRQRVGVIDKRLKYAFDRLDFNEKMRESNYGKSVLGFIKKYRKLTETQKQELDYLINNHLSERVREFARQNDMLSEYEEARTLLDELFEEGNKAGMDMGFLQEYFPTKVNDYEGLISYLKGTDKWSKIEMALNQIDPNHQMSEEDRANAINNILRGYNRLDPVGKKGFQKERKIFHKTPEIMKFYAHADEALMRYVSGMSSALSIRTAFNVKGAFSAADSIGGIVDELIKSGKITHKEEAFITKMLRARLNYARTAPMVALLKNFGYLGTMNNLTSAITQIGDLYANFYKYNFGTAMKALFGKSEVTKDDLHIDSIWEEFSDDSWSSVAVNKLFSAIGLNKMDAFGKNTSINGAWIDLKERLKNNDSSLLEDLTAAFGSGAKKVMEDIKNNNITEDVKLMIWSQLADTQPIGRSGVPVGYLNNPHGRIIYQLKTYTINQLSLFYADGIYKIKKGMATKNKKLFLQGIGNTAKLALLLTVFNAGADALKNLIMGRKIDISDTLLSNMLWNIGVSKYTFYRGQRDGYARALLENYLLPPQISMGDDAYMDVKKIATGKRKPSDTVAVTYVPFGRMWYWWFGGGRTQEKKKGNKPFEVEL